MNAVGGSDMFVPCGACGHTDNETNLPVPYGQLHLGAQYTCEACGSTLTLVDYDYWTDLGHAYTWEATPPASLVAAVGAVVAQVAAARRAL